MRRTNRKRLDVRVELPERHRLGSFANAFRVEEAGPGHCFLDFLLYSATENRALVVTRIRLAREMLPVIRDRLAETLGLTELVLVGTSGTVH